MDLEILTLGYGAYLVVFLFKQMLQLQLSEKEKKTQYSAMVGAD